MFHIGQKVVCVNVQGKPYGLKLNQIYTIEAIYKKGDWIDILDHTIIFIEDSFGLEEVQCPNCNERHVAFSHWRFKPIQTTDISIFTKLLAPKPKSKIRKLENV